MKKRGMSAPYDPVRDGDGEPPSGYTGVRVGDERIVDGLLWRCVKLSENLGHSCARGRLCKARWNIVLVSAGGDAIQSPAGYDDAD